MNKDDYINYLETIVISLLNERKTEADVKCDCAFANASYDGFTFSTFNIRDEIAKKRVKKMLEDSKK